MREAGGPVGEDLAARAHRRVESARSTFDLGDIAGGVGVGLGLNVLLQPLLGILSGARDTWCLVPWRMMCVTQLTYLVPLAVVAWRRKSREFALGLAVSAALSVLLASAVVGYLG